ncbi:MAG: CopG family transcriptional regulator [Promethearchaeia archaeon]|nr:MAG: CopG family transcriptional regulator [Candidatus Lokiarchaeia archaeon]
MGSEHQKMKNITIALPEIFVENIEKIQKIGLVPSRSEAIRLAIREFLKKEVHNCQLLGYDLSDNKKK